jgi:S1-C subfamily serine protease
MTKSLLLIFLAATLFGQQSTPHKKNIATIAKEANGAVVSIVMSDKEGHPVAQGSGFLISKDGWIVTNYHVIKSGSSAMIKLPNGAFFHIDGVVASDKSRDVAIIKAHGNDFRTLILGDSDRLEVGDEVVAIGSPLLLESTVSNGIVSGIRTIKEEGGKFLQITAPISPGSSGGPLFNMAAEVVGITTSHRVGGQNLNFAIPIDDVKPMLPSEVSSTRAFPNEVEDDKDEPSPKIKAEADPAKVQSAFVWGESGSAIFSTAIDPLTGNKSRKLSYQGVEVGERVDIVGSDYNCSFWACKEGGGVIALLKVTFTLVNNTKLPLQVEEYSSTLPSLTAKQAKEYFKCGSKRCSTKEVNRDMAAIPAGGATQFELYLSNTNCGNESVNNGPFHTVCSGPFRVQVKLRGKNFVFVEPAG